MITMILVFLGLSFSANATELQFLGDANFATGTVFKETQLGGLSATSWDPKTGLLFCLSDDRSSQNPSRYYGFKVEVARGKFRIEPQQVAFLKQPSGQTFPESALDPEGFAIGAGGRIFFSSEGDMRPSPRTNPSIHELDSQGKILGTIDVPAQFLPEPSGPQAKGIQNNRGFEGLTLAQDGMSLIAGIESSLLQDDTPSSFDKGSLVRLLRMDTGTRPPKPAQEYVYDLDPIPRLLSDPKATGENGLSEILEIGGGKFLALERGLVTNGTELKMTVRIYSFTFQGADDVASIPSILAVQGKKPKPVTKKLVMNLDEILTKLTPGFQSLDNLEGMTLGPKLANGHRSLILVADNNFSKTQRTQFLAFELVDR